MPTQYVFQKDHYFKIYLCEFVTYTTPDGETLGDVVDRWSPTGYGSQYDSITEAMNRYLLAPFSKDPRNWYYDSTNFTVIAETLSSRICENYAKDAFAKRPTKSEMTKFERGQQELYIVQFQMTLQEVVIQDLSAEVARSEGITPLY